MSDQATTAEKGDLDQLIEGVYASLPELSLIGNDDLRQRVALAWAIALSETEFARIEDMRSSGDWKSPPQKTGTQANHLSSTCTVALGIAEGMEKIYGPIGIDRDVLIAGSLVHDVGKAYEVSPRNIARWKESPASTGLPAVRHPVYGVHVALMAGLPEAVVHIVGGHSVSSEGSLINPSMECLIVQYADLVVWKILDRAGLMASKMWPDLG
jgi:hypothetical protein